MADESIHADVFSEDLASTIAAFEEILQVIPNDPTTLESLCEALLRAGEHDRALKHALNLAEVLEQNERWDDLQKHMDTLLILAQEFAEARDCLERVGQHMPGAHHAAAPKLKQGVDISSELTLAWNLFEDGELTQEEYSSIVQDLTEMATRKVEVPVTVQHILFDRGFKNPERILNYLSRKSGCPFIALPSFDISRELQARLDLSFMESRGAMVFGQVGGELMVALLNPLNSTLKEKVQQLVGSVCHFFLTSAPAYDQVLSTIRTAIATAAAKS
jgi:hypothetical protein